MFSPIFSAIADGDAKEFRVVRTIPVSNPKLPEPYQNLTLRREPSEPVSPTDISNYYSSRYIVAPPPPAPRARLVGVDAVPTKEISSIEEAETMVLELALKQTSQTFIPRSATSTLCGDGTTPLHVLITQSANLVSTRSRRGPANNIFLHPDNIPYLRAHHGFKLKTDDEIERVGLWDFAGVFRLGPSCVSIRVFTRPEFTKDRIVLMYKGFETGDGPAQLINRDGRTYIAMLSDIENAISVATDYVTSIIIQR